MITIRAPEIEEQVAAAGGDGRTMCPLCKKPSKALCSHGTLEYSDGSSNRCFNLETEDDKFDRMFR